MDDEPLLPESSQPEGTPQAPNPTPSPKIKLSKRTLFFIALLSVILLVITVSTYVLYSKNQNNITEVPDQEVEETTEPDEEDSGKAPLYPVVTDLEVATIPTADDSLSNDYPIGEDWQEYYIEEIDTTVYHFGEEPVRELRPATNREEYRIPFGRDLTIWITTIPSTPMEELGKRHGAPFNSVIDSIVNFNSYLEESQDLVYTLPVKNQDYDLVVSFDRPELVVFEDMDLVQQYIFNIQNPGLIKFDPEIVYYAKNDTEYQIFNNNVFFGEGEGNFNSPDIANVKEFELFPIVKFSGSYPIFDHRKVENTIFILNEENNQTTLYEYTLESNQVKEYKYLPHRARFDSIIDTDQINITMPCTSCDGDSVQQGRIKLTEETFTDFGKTIYKVTGYHGQTQVTAFDQEFTCDILNVEDLPIELQKIAQRDIDQGGFSFDKAPTGETQLDINFTSQENPGLLKKIRESDPDNPVTLTLSERWIYGGFGPGPCFSMYMVEGVE